MEMDADAWDFMGISKPDCVHILDAAAKNMRRKAAEVRKLEAVVGLVPHIHNPATCEVERKARATTYFDSHGPEPCQLCDALTNLEDAC